jgi:hypothetical protein
VCCTYVRIAFYRIAVIFYLFTPDPSPDLHKTKRIFFFGRPGKVNYPDPVKLYGQDFPWVESAVHLGHTLQQLTNMEKDCQVARARFIDKTEPQLCQSGPDP